MREPQKHEIEDQKKAAEPSTDAVNAEDMTPSFSNLIKYESKLIDREFSHYRNSAIKSMPRFLVNNASNMIAGMHIFSEFLMFKANGTQLLLDKEKGNKLNYLTRPPMRVWNSFSGNSRLQISPKDLLKPGYYAQSLRNLVNTKKATETDRAIDPKLINRWQARASLVGLVTWTLNLFIPEQKETPEDVEKMTDLATRNPIGYVGERLRQAVWIPEWSKHKRQMTGLGVMISGICSTLGGFRNVQKLSSGRHYYFNPDYCMTGLVSLASSFPLLFGTENGDAWSKFGSIHLLRCVFLPKSIAKKFEKDDIGVGWYTAGAAGFQMENAVAALIGGAQVLKDGTVVDNKGIQKAARQHALEAKQARKEAKQQARHGNDKDVKAVNDDIAHANDERPVMPESKISHAAKAEIAMPERRVAKEQEMAAAAQA